MRCYKSCVNDIFQSLLTLLRRGCPITLVCLDVKINLRMPRTKSKAALDENVPIHPNKSGFGELTTVEIMEYLQKNLTKDSTKIKAILTKASKNLRRRTTIISDWQDCSMRLSIHVSPQRQT